MIVLRCTSPPDSPQRLVAQPLSARSVRSTQHKRAAVRARAVPVQHCRCRPLPSRSARPGGRRQRTWVRAPSTIAAVARCPTAGSVSLTAYLIITETDKSSTHFLALSPMRPPRPPLDAISYFARRPFPSGTTGTTTPRCYVSCVRASLTSSRRRRCGRPMRSGASRTAPTSCGRRSTIRPAKSGQPLTSITRSTTTSATRTDGRCTSRFSASSTCTSCLRRRRRSA